MTIETIMLRRMGLIRGEPVAIGVLKRLFIVLVVPIIWVLAVAFILFLGVLNILWELICKAYTYVVTGK